jgi:hypothetical protein
VSHAPATAVYALVSLADYVDPDWVADLVRPDASAAGTSGSPDGLATSPDRLATIAAYARARVPGQQTELVRLPANRVPADLVAGMTEVADRKTRQAAEYRAKADQDAGSSALYRSIAAVTSQEAAAYRAACACVYALLVRATPVILASVAHRSGVRVVDAAPELADPANGVFVAPLPEQLGTVGPLP